jgi:uncharacterized protein YxjI
VKHVLQYVNGHAGDVYNKITVFFQSFGISVVMVIVLTSNVLDHGFKLQSDRTKDYKIGICCFSAKHQGIRSKTGWLKIRIM